MFNCHFIATFYHGIYIKIRAIIEFYYLLRARKRVVIFARKIYKAGRKYFMCWFLSRLYCSGAVRG